MAAEESRMKDLLSLPADESPGVLVVADTDPRAR
jgi:hypothetical protein